MLTAHELIERLVSVIPRPQKNLILTDVLDCPACNGRMRLMALIEQRNVARRILRHLGMRDHSPPIASAQLDDDYAA